MAIQFGFPSNYSLSNHGLHNLGSIYWNLTPPTLVEHIIRRKEGILTPEGAVAVNTGVHTGRSAQDKFIVKQDLRDLPEIWWGKINFPLSPAQFERLYQKVCAYFQGRDVYVQDMVVGAQPEFKVPIRIISETAWHSLFSYDLFIRLPVKELADHVPQFTVLHASNFTALPQEDGVRSPVFIVIDFFKRIVLIGGTSYAGEIKKSIFTVMNYLMPQQKVLSMHCSANVGQEGDVALFFGLSGTGKTTLSSDPERRLIGDDEHGWSDEGVFNFEGGCYAKTIRLHQELEPLIWDATHRFGAVLENIVIDPDTRGIDFDNEQLTENTRGAYPLYYIENRIEEGCAGHPQNIFFLAADAFGILPPLARLTSEQAMYYFLSGYTSKLAGTEKGLGSQPQATFSTCFGAPFLPLHPAVYAELLGHKIQQTCCKVWLVNTGWTGGPYGIGHRISLPYTRALIRAALQGALDDLPCKQDPFFGCSVPQYCPGVPDKILEPRLTWPTPEAYNQQAATLVDRFQQNFAQYEAQVSPEILAAGPLQPAF